MQNIKCINSINEINVVNESQFFKLFDFRSNGVT